MSDQQTKQAILSSLKAFAAKPLAPAAIALFESLGYRSTKRLALNPNTPANFLATFEQGRKLHHDQALFPEWKSVDFLFQLTDDEVRSAAGGNQQFLFDSRGTWDGAAMESCLFFAITLAKPYYTRTGLSAITRAVNRLFDMPAMLLFRHGDTLTLAVINRRLHKRDEGRDVLTKVTLIKDIRVASVEILADLSFDALQEQHHPSNFKTLHDAWQKTLDITELNKRFYQEVADWYFWALDNVRFPKDAPKDADDRDAISLIRLLTRLIFCWFIKEKGLIPDTIFNERALAALTKGFAPRDHANTDSVYYKAILQNLFFATLNTEMDPPAGPAIRRFSRQARDDHMIHTVWRHERLVADKARFQALFKDIPFLNGGLFECLDDREGAQETRIDGFSDTPKSQAVVPDFLFFGPEREMNLSGAYGDDKHQRAKVRGLLRIFEDYKFTIEENTPIEEDVALDPELLGHVFENLLAAYNPETGAVARKTTGSFYTPRVAVGYMVDEALLVYLCGWMLEKIPALKADVPALEKRLRHLFAWQLQSHEFTAAEAEVLISAIHALKGIDIACGSGAFPMGLLLKLVWILRKLDPGNERWKALQLAAIPDANLRAAAERVFTGNLPDYTRKLYLIENCLYGVDIQPIAVQIAKLRFFISLVVDQKVDDAQPNRGVLALPNLETRIVAANSLLGLKRGQLMLGAPDIAALEAELRQVRHDHFNARRYDDKKRLRKRDRELCDQLARTLTESGIFTTADARKLATWNPYDQNASAPFFDPEWMFGLTAGFDLSIGNPPYVRQEQLRRITVKHDGKDTALKDVLEGRFECFTGTSDLYVYFFERSFQLLKPGGVLCYISSNSFLNSGFGESLRAFLNERTRIHVLVDFAETGVFTAITEPCIIIVAKERPPNDAMRLLQWDEEEPLENLPTTFAAKAFTLPQKEFRKEGWRLESPAVLRVFAKLRRAGTPLGKLVNGRFYYGIKTGLNGAFVVDRATRDRLISEHKSSASLLKPFVMGRDVRRWSIQFAERYLITLESSENREHPWSGQLPSEAERTYAKAYPAIHNYHEPFRQALRKRSDQGRYPWELRSCDYWSEFSKTKLVWQDISRMYCFAWDESEAICDCTCFTLPDVSQSVLAILQSTLGRWWVHTDQGVPLGGFIRLKNQYMSQFPVPQVPPAEKKGIETLVSRILKAKGANLAANISAQEREIDDRVYRLYGLSKDEIKIVEDGSK